MELAAAAVTLVLGAWLASLLLLSVWKTSYMKRNLPPGPTPLPLVGNLLQMKSGDIVNSFLSLRKKYGDVFTIYLGHRRAVVVCGFESVKKALLDQGEDFLGRGDVPSVDKVYKHYGIAFTNNMERWKQLRRFTVMTLKNFGMGKRSIEERIQEEAQCLLEEFRNTKGLPIDPRDLFGCVSANVICSVMLGKRYNFKDDEFLTLIRTINDCFLEMSSVWGQLYDTFPYIMDYLPGPHNKIFKYLEDLLEFIRNRVKINQETLDPSSPRDYIDCFLIRMEQEKENSLSEFNISNLVTSTIQTFFAGVETIGTTLTYGFLILLKYPSIREKVQEEIDRVIGRDRQPSFQDRSEMPYTDAVCHEIQRFCNLLPFGVPRAAVYDTVFQGYNIPKGTNIFIMLHTVLRDPKMFINPEDFNPGRFLNEDGSFKTNEGFIPLSAGKRMCPGEGLVRMELFLILTTVLQHFKIKPTLELEEIDITPITGGFGNFPKPYQLDLISR